MTAAGRCDRAWFLNSAVLGLVAIPAVRLARIHLHLPEIAELLIVILASLCLVFGLVLFTRDLASEHPADCPFVLRLQRILLWSGGPLATLGGVAKAALVISRAVPSANLRVGLMTVMVLGIALLTSVVTLRLE